MANRCSIYGENILDDAHAFFLSSLRYTHIPRSAAVADMSAFPSSLFVFFLYLYSLQLTRQDETTAISFNLFQYNPSTAQSKLYMSMYSLSIRNKNKGS